MGGGGDTVNENNNHQGGDECDDDDEGKLRITHADCHVLVVVKVPSNVVEVEDVHVVILDHANHPQAQAGRSRSRDVPPMQ